LNRLKRGIAPFLLTWVLVAPCLPKLRGTPLSDPVPQTARHVEAPPAAGTAALITQGFDLLSRQDNAGAEASFRRAIEAQPEIASAHRGLALAFWARGEAAAAVREMTIATQLAPGDADAHLDLGNFVWAMSAQPQAEKASVSKNSSSDFLSLAIHEMNEAASLRPQDENIQLSLARAYLEASQTNDALAHAQEALRLAPKNPVAHVILGQAHLMEREEALAESEFKKALELDPNDGSVHVELGRLRVDQRRFDEAQKEFQRAIELSARSAPAYAAWAELLVNTGHESQARGLLEKAVALDSRDWHSQFRLAKLLVGTQEAPRATAMLQQIARTHPDFLPAREQLGLDLLRRGDLEGAAAQAEALEGKNPHAAEGHHVMALVLWKRRDYEGSLAESALAEANEADPTAMLALQSVELWVLDRKKEARLTFVRAAKGEPHLGTSEVFCRLILCDARDIGPVEDFLRKNRWAIAGQSSP
jgi:Tfp pilus assembly protein PilF